MEQHLKTAFLICLVLLMVDIDAVSESLSDEAERQTIIKDDDVIYTIPQISYGETKHRASRETHHCLEKLDVLLPTPKKNIELSLILATKLIAPKAVVEKHIGNITSAAPLTDNCYYQGKVEGSLKSYAALTRNHGLTGLFMYEGHEYSLQPVEMEKYIEESDSLDVMHIIKKINATGYEGLLNDSFNLNDVDRNSRIRRQAPSGSHNEKYLEVMVVMDSTVVDFHGDENSELFILALFNMMNMVYSHSSLGTPIHLSLVKIVLLDDDTAEDLWEGSDPRTTLDRFCIWSATNSMRDYEEGHYDFSMYLSRERMAPAGYAPVTGMCRPDRSCALVKEDGFSTAFVAAHEIGHTIGMSHDGEGTNKCVNEPKRGSIMAPLVMANLNNYFWSPCSKEEIETIISSLYCMNDDPFEMKWSELQIPLGQNWDLDDQCRKDFGEGHKLCSTLTHRFNPCEHLWCSTPENRYLCKTKRAPPLPGSKCAQGRWCLNSQCVVANPDDPIWTDPMAGHFNYNAVDGDWSNWSSWSKCSTTCGKGIKSRTRRCDNPKPMLGGKDCSGESYELRLCDLPEQMRLVCKRFSNLSFSVRRSCMKHQVYYRNCNKEIDDSRAEQCSKYDKQGRTYRPFQPENANEQCLLNCQTKEKNIPLYGKIQALDGTFCSYENKHTMCYAGTCIPLGCDGKFGSQLTEDECGVCQGDNSNCTQRKTYYTDKLDKGKQLLVRLYPGTRHFSLRKPDDAFSLILVSRKTNESLLPEEVKGTFSRVDNGILWKFTNNRSQLLETVGPLQTEYDIIIASDYTGLRSTLSISYTEPLSIKREDDLGVKNGDLQYEQKNAKVSQITTAGSKRYVWEQTGWTNCSQTCGTGWQTEMFDCVNTRLNRTTHEILCRGEVRPVPEKKKCFITECQTIHRWVTSDWTHCPEDICHLGDDFIQNRWAFCVKDSTQQGANWERVDDSMCSGDIKPELSRACDKSHCIPESFWKTGPWTECSVTCGVGVQHRNVECVTVEDDNTVLNSVCTDERPSSIETCSKIPCEEENPDQDLGSDEIDTTTQVNDPHDYVTTEAHFHPEGRNEEEEMSTEDSIGGTLDYKIKKLPPVPESIMTSRESYLKTTRYKEEQTTMAATQPTTRETTSERVMAVTTSEYIPSDPTTPTKSTTDISTEQSTETQPTTMPFLLMSTGLSTTQTTMTSKLLTTEQKTTAVTVTLDKKSKDGNHMSTTQPTQLETDIETKPKTFFTNNVTPKKQYVSSTSSLAPTTKYFMKNLTTTTDSVIQTSSQAYETTQSQFSEEAPHTTSETDTNRATGELTTYDLRDLMSTNTPEKSTTYTPYTSTSGSGSITPKQTTIEYDEEEKSKTSTATPSNQIVGWWTTSASQEETTTESLSNEIVSETEEDEGKACSSDLSNLCVMMSDSKCRLLLFKRLCCITCQNFV